jgi:hypothetical protein
MRAPDWGSPGTSKKNNTEFGNSIERMISSCSAAHKTEVIAVFTSESRPTCAIGAQDENSLKMLSLRLDPKLTASERAASAEA